MTVAYSVVTEGKCTHDLKLKESIHNKENKKNNNNTSTK